MFRCLKEDLKKLEKLRDESSFRKFLDYEDEQKQIVYIFDRINEASVQFEVRTTLVLTIPFSTLFSW